MVNTKKQLQDIFNRLNKLDTKNIKVIMDMIADMDNGNIYYVIKALDRHNKVIEQDTIYDIPKEYITKYLHKYNKIAELQPYKLINGKLISDAV